MKTKLTLLSMLIGATLCAQPTIWMMGDSTMASYSRKHVPLTGWGQVLNEYCKPGVKVENMALSGWSTTMFMKKNEKTGKSRFDTFVDKIKPGDYLIIQFGHNDQKKYSPKAYASPEKYREFMMFFANETKSAAPRRFSQLRSAAVALQTAKRSVILPSIPTSHALWRKKTGSRWWT